MLAFDLPTHKRVLGLEAVVARDPELAGEAGGFHELPRRVVGKVLVDLCCGKIKLGLRSIEHLVLCLLVLQVELSNDVSPVIPSVN